MKRQSGRVLLINPSLMMEAGYGKVRRLMRPVPYINLAYLAAALERAGDTVVVHDDSVNVLTRDTLAALLRRVMPDLVGISCLTPQATRTAELAGMLRSLSPGTPLVLGNIHAGYFDEQLVLDGTADIVVRGEADTTIVELSRAVRNGGDPSGVHGITFQRDGAVVRTGERRLVADLDSLPFPAWHLFPYREYSFTPLTTIARPLFPFLGSRGCPYRCTFCVNRQFHRTYRKRKPEPMADEVEHLVSAFGARQVSFFDSNFPLQRNHCLEFCTAMRQRGLQRRVLWTTMTRPDLVDKPVLRSMKEAGCRRVFFGLESGDDGVLARNRKGFTVEDARRAAALTREAGLEGCGFFMLGLPGDTRETSRKTVDLALRLPLDFANFNLTVPYPGTEIYERLKEAGDLPECSWEHYATFNPDAQRLSYTPEGLDAAWLIDMQKRALLRFYFRPRLIVRHLLRIRSIPLRDMCNGAWFYLTFRLSPSRFVAGMRERRGAVGREPG